MGHPQGNAYRFRAVYTTSKKNSLVGIIFEIDGTITDVNYCIVCFDKQEESTISFDRFIPSFYWIIRTALFTLVHISSRIFFSRAAHVLIDNFRLVYKSVTSSIISLWLNFAAIRAFCPPRLSYDHKPRRISNSG